MKKNAFPGMDLEQRWQNAYAAQRCCRVGDVSR
jgi:hypothetical protein